jgi:hypothetical protein
MVKMLMSLDGTFSRFVLPKQAEIAFNHAFEDCLHIIVKQVAIFFTILIYLYSRDAMIVTTLDTITSLLAGCTIFSILGNLIYEMGAEDIKSVVKGGPGLAFVSYPDAIAKFDAVPQVSDIICEHSGQKAHLLI